MRIDRFARLAVTWSQFQPKKDFKGNVIETYCNRFVSLCAVEVGCVDLGHPGEMSADHQARALDLLTRLPKPSWREIDADGAAKEADKFKLVVASHPDPDGAGGRRGHVCLVIPGGVAWSKKHGQDLPYGANVGRECWYGRLISYAFPPNMPPRFWSWAGLYRADAEVR